MMQEIEHPVGHGVPLIFLFFLVIISLCFVECPSPVARRNCFGTSLFGFGIE